MAASSEKKKRPARVTKPLPNLQPPRLVHRPHEDGDPRRVSFIASPIAAVPIVAVDSHGLNLTLDPGSPDSQHHREARRDKT